MLRRSASLAAIASTALDAVVATDRDGVIIGWNGVAERMFGWSEPEVIGRNISNVIIPQRDRAAHVSGMRRFNDTGKVRILGTRLEKNGLRRDGTEIPIELAVMLAESDGGSVFVSFMRDMSRQREAEAKIAELQSELVHLSRVNAMGTMAAMLAHELNQPLCSASNYLAAASRLLPPSEAAGTVDARLAVEQAGLAVSRAGRTIKSIREMVSYKPVPEAQVRLSELVGETLRLLGAAFPVRPEVRIDRDADWIIGHKAQVEQVLLNLIRNGAEALADRPDARLTISTERRGERVAVRVADNGPGVDPWIKANLFSPFNSVKPDGLGIGLSVCRTIVEQHGGEIWLEDSAGETAFCFTVPVAPQQAKRVA
jgi:two-component system sensor kinase FixL